MSSRVRVVALSLLGIVLVGTEAFAQSGAERTAAARESAAFRVGPWYLTPAISIDNIGFDSNVFFDPETQEPVSDFLISMTPSVKAALPIASRALITADLKPRADYYRRFSNARSFTPQGSVLAEMFSTRMDFFAGGSFQAGRRRPSFEIERRVDTSTLDVTGGVRYRLRPRLTFELAGSRTATKYESEEFQGVDLDAALTGFSTGARASVRRRLTAKTSVDLSADFSSSTFDASPEKDGTRFQLTPGLSFAPNALIAGGLRVGMLKFMPESAALPSFTGVVADVDLSYTLREATRVAVRWRRDLQYSYEPLQPYYVISGLGASLRRQLFGRFDAIVAFDQYESSYRDLVDLDAGDSAAPPVSRVDTNRTYSGDIGMRLSRRSRVGLRVSTSERRSNRHTDRNYRGTQIGLSYAYGM